jgi:predicted nuclease with TOPRIM domain
MYLLDSLRVAESSESQIYKIQDKLSKTIEDSKESILRLQDSVTEKTNVIHQVENLQEKISSGNEFLKAHFLVLIVAAIFFFFFLREEGILNVSTYLQSLSVFVFSTIVHFSIEYKGSFNELKKAFKDALSSRSYFKRTEYVKQTANNSINEYETYISRYQNILDKAESELNELDDSLFEIEREKINLVNKLFSNNECIARLKPE